MTLRFIQAAAAFTILTAPSAAGDLVIPDVTYPAIAAHSQTPEGFAPSGWRVELSAQGDLNEDGIPDLVAVLRDTDPRNVIDNSSLGPPRFDTNPRILIVALQNPKGGYDLALQNHTLIPRDTEPTLEDVLEDAEAPEIRQGTLRLSLHLFASAGGSTMGSTTYSFRNQKGRFVLVGYDSTMVERMSGEIKSVSIDYMMGKRKDSAGRIDNDRDKVRWKTLRRRPLMTLDRVGDGMAFDPDLPSR
jgi:hypothetical protein